MGAAAARRPVLELASRFRCVSDCWWLSHTKRGPRCLQGPLDTKSGADGATMAADPGRSVRPCGCTSGYGRSLAWACPVSLAPLRCAAEQPRAMAPMLVQPVPVHRNLGSSVRLCRSSGSCWSLVRSALALTAAACPACPLLLAHARCIRMRRRTPNLRSLVRPCACVPGRQQKTRARRARPSCNRSQFASVSFPSETEQVFFLLLMCHLTRFRGDHNLLGVVAVCGPIDRTAPWLSPTAARARVHYRASDVDAVYLCLRLSQQRIWCRSRDHDTAASSREHPAGCHMTMLPLACWRRLARLACSGPR